VLLALLVAGCPDAAPQNVILTPQGETVQIATAAPDLGVYVLVGELRAEAMGVDADEATQSARNELRNQAAALRATFVTIDKNEGAGGGYRDRIRVILIGRAFRPKD
jgi:hypothetical protein